MTLKTKKIIAREGLIILGIFLGIIISSNLAWVIASFIFGVQDQQILNKIFDIIFYIFLWLYPLYLIVRFVVWAIKILRRKES